MERMAGGACLLVVLVVVLVVAKYGLSVLLGLSKKQNKQSSPDYKFGKPRKEGTMYGLLFESVQHHICLDYGDKKWSEVLEDAGLKNTVFTTHKVYKDEMLLRLARSCSRKLKGGSLEHWLCCFGKYFVEFCTSYGYDKILRVAGRHYRDFLHGIDNLHEMIRFSYPQMRSPSFLVLSEDSKGCVLMYKSKREGFKHYVIGQLKQCAKNFFHIDLEVIVLKEVTEGKTRQVTFRLNFDNNAFNAIKLTPKCSDSVQYSDIPLRTFFKIFPFCIVFDEKMIIKAAGSSICELLRGDRLEGTSVVEKFKIRRPLVPLTWQNVISLQCVIFELEYRRGRRSSSSSDVCDKSNSGSTRLLLKGQMKYIDSWKSVTFLCTPLMSSLEDLENGGLYINEMSLFDNSRDMVLAGWQHASQLEWSIDQQMEKTEQIEENLSKLEEWRNKSDNLLYSMIPKSIAERLKHGEDPINTCEILDNVTILFNYLIGFSEICSRASPMAIVECINNVFTMYDKVMDKYDVFKVETLGDAVYMVAGGVPDRNPDHAAHVAGLALDILELSSELKDPVTQDKLQSRTGIHTGSVVAGVVGRRMPQYCLFGDSVNTASRMQSYSQAGRIHISEPTHECLKGTKFVTVLRGKVDIKGKGEMNTYWLAGREGEERTRTFIENHKKEIIKKRDQNLTPPISPIEPEMEVVQGLLPLDTKTRRKFENGFDFHSIHATTSTTNFALNFILPGTEGRRPSTSENADNSSKENSPTDEDPQQQLSPIHRHSSPHRLSPSMFHLNFDPNNKHRRSSSNLQDNTDLRDKTMCNGNHGYINTDNDLSTKTLGPPSPSRVLRRRSLKSSVSSTSIFEKVLEETDEHQDTDQPTSPLPRKCVFKLEDL